MPKKTLSNELLEEIWSEIAPMQNEGKVAQYIPALRKIKPNQFGMIVTDNQGNTFKIGDTTTLFSIQSISKTFSLALAMQKVGTDIWDRVGREPSGNRFNSLIQLEYEKGIPRNPFINAGALVITDILISVLDDPKKEILEFIQELAGDKSIGYDFKLAKSEQAHGFTNAALVNYMKSHKNIVNDIDEVLDVYFHQCSIMISCESLVKCFSVLAHQGISPICHKEILSSRQTKRINAIMTTCGFYDQAGEFSFRVGLPGKSGVSGGVAVVCPDQFTSVVWSPRLNDSGNSVLGVEALDLLTTKLGVSIY